jgi:hypothetical protein
VCCLICAETMARAAPRPELLCKPADLRGLVMRLANVAMGPSLGDRCGSDAMKEKLACCALG